MAEATRSVWVSARVRTHWPRSTPHSAATSPAPRPHRPRCEFAKANGLERTALCRARASGNLPLLQAFAKLSASEIETREQQFAAQSNAQSALGSSAAARCRNDGTAQGREQGTGRHAPRAARDQAGREGCQPTAPTGHRPQRGQGHWPASMVLPPTGTEGTSDGLLAARRVNLIAGDGSARVMAEGTSWGAPVPIDVAIESFLQDGAIVVTQGYDNREMNVRVRITAPTWRRWRCRRRSLFASSGSQHADMDPGCRACRRSSRW